MYIPGPRSVELAYRTDPDGFGHRIGLFALFVLVLTFTFMLVAWFDPVKIYHRKMRKIFQTHHEEHIAIPVSSHTLHQG